MYVHELLINEITVRNMSDMTSFNDMKAHISYSKYSMHAHIVNYELSSSC